MRARRQRADRDCGRAGSQEGRAEGRRRGLVRERDRAAGRRAVPGIKPRYGGREGLRLP